MNIFYKYDREIEERLEDVKKRNKLFGIYEKASKRMNFYFLWLR